MKTEQLLNPTIEKELIKVIMEMEHDYDSGIREFQEAIHYAIYHIAVNSSKNCTKKEKVKYLLYLRDLSRRLNELENIFQ